MPWTTEAPHPKVGRGAGGGVDGSAARRGRPPSPPRPSAQLTLCQGAYLRFFWQDDPDTAGVAQVAGAACPADFSSSPVIAPPTRSGDATVKLDAPGTYWFACPVHCAAGQGGLVQEVEVVAA